jgi:hypothetical protein
MIGNLLPFAVAARAMIGRSELTGTFPVGRGVCGLPNCCGSNSANAAGNDYGVRRPGLTRGEAEGEIAPAQTQYRCLSFGMTRGHTV